MKTKEACPKTGKPHEFAPLRKGGSVEICTWCHRFRFTNPQPSTLKPATK